ncbi:MAG: hypothetical protein L6Q26_12105 [Anaerolineales bacterium]|nr:hypothetical protein [Anaerolineales bacterium]NUQ86744.1 SRPBCC family protein [Anaerolineales bacterium]
MGAFELNIFIDCARDAIYDHLAEPINMIGLQPFLTEIDVLKEKRSAEGVVLRPFYTVETFLWMGLVTYKRKSYIVIRLTKPKEELEFHVHAKPGIETVFHYRFQQSNDQRTQITQTVRFVKVNRLLAGFVREHARRTQRALLSNLKARMEKQVLAPPS